LSRRIGGVGSPHGERPAAIATGGGGAVVEPAPDDAVEQVLEGDPPALRLGAEPAEQMGVDIDGGAHEVMLKHHLLMSTHHAGPIVVRYEGVQPDVPCPIPR
jgi:hypothetical protein